MKKLKKKYSAVQDLISKHGFCWLVGVDYESVYEYVG